MPHRILVAGANTNAVTESVRQDSIELVISNHYFKIKSCFHNCSIVEIETDDFADLPQKLQEFEGEEDSPREPKAEESEDFPIDLALPELPFEDLPDKLDP